MANIVITTNTICFKVDFGVYAGNGQNNVDNRGVGYYRRDDIRTCHINYDQDYLMVMMKSGHNWYLQIPSYSGNLAMIVDSVNATAITSLSQLRTLIGDLIL